MGCVYLYMGYGIYDIYIYIYTIQILHMHMIYIYIYIYIYHIYTQRIYIYIYIYIYILPMTRCYLQSIHHNNVRYDTPNVWEPQVFALSRIYRKGTKHPLQLGQTEDINNVETGN